MRGRPEQPSSASQPVLGRFKRMLLDQPFLAESVAVNRVYVAYKGARQRLDWGDNLLRPMDLAKGRQSDTLMLLAAGDSINTISPEEWRQIERHDVAGFSYSCLLPVEQTFYFYEAPVAPRLVEMHRKKILPLIRERRASGQLRRVIWKNPRDRKAEVELGLQEFERMGSINLLGGGDRLIRNFIPDIVRDPFWQQILVQCRGTVFGLAVLASVLGYRNVVFLGVDLSNSLYFYEADERYRHHGLENPLALEMNVEDVSSGVHPTNDPRLGTPIADSLRSLCAALPQTRWYVGTPHSRLSQFLPSWDWSAPFA